MVGGGIDKVWRWVPLVSHCRRGKSCYRVENLDHQNGITFLKDEFLKDKFRVLRIFKW